ncbi:hypothetical protein RB599_009115 [Gaeumannomyces hyphopodioides]
MPANKDISESPAVRAARRYVRMLEAGQKRAHLRRGCPLSNGGSVESIRDFAARVKQPYSSIQRHVQSLQATGLPALSSISTGRPRTLTEAEDAALVAYIVKVEKASRPATKDDIISAATLLRSRRRPPVLSKINSGWYSAWKNNHPELRQTATRPVEASRLGFEAQIEEVKTWYARSSEMVAKQKVTASAVWNGDEVGCRIGVRDGRIQAPATLSETLCRPSVSCNSGR